MVQLTPHYIAAGEAEDERRPPDPIRVYTCELGCHCVQGFETTRGAYVWSSPFGAKKYAARQAKTTTTRPTIKLVLPWSGQSSRLVCA